MAGTFTAVNLGELPAPSVVETLDFEIIFQSMLADLRQRDKTFSALVESDPAFKILEVAAFREMVIRQRVNDAARAVMLAYARGTDLDHLGANDNVSRLLIAPANPLASPPTPDVWEEDEDFRRRIVLSKEGYTTAGPVGSYVFHALSAAGDVLDVAVESPPSTAGTVRVAVMSRTGSGAAPAELLALVAAALNVEEVRPLCDTVVVSSAVITDYSVEATLETLEGVGQEQALQAARDRIAVYVEKTRRLGLDATISGIYGALHAPGVHRVNLISPAADIVTAWNGAARCTSIAVSVVADD